MEVVNAPTGSPSFEDEYRRLAASDSRYEAQAGKMMLDFLDRLRRGVIGPRLFASSYIHHELWLQYFHGTRRTLITAKIDHKDCSPVVDGVPLLHYRLTYSLPEASPEDSRIELRTRDVNDAYEFVLEAIKTCQRDF